MGRYVLLPLKKGAGGIFGSYQSANASSSPAEAILDPDNISHIQMQHMLKIANFVDFLMQLPEIAIIIYAIVGLDHQQIFQWWVMGRDISILRIFSLAPIGA